VNDSSETWLPCVGWEGFYEVSDLGRVRSLRRLTASGVRGGQILKQSVLPNGYLRVGLYAGAQQSRTQYVHRLVALTFLGPCPEGMEVLHGLVNLSYGIHIENCEDRARDGAGHAKLNRVLAAEIRARVVAGEPRIVVARAYGVTSSTISKIMKGDRWRAA